MANVNIKFNNKDYLLSCDDGQEESLKELANHLDSKYGELKKKLGNIGESKLMLITAIKMSDEDFVKKIENDVFQKVTVCTPSPLSDCKSTPNVPPRPPKWTPKRYQNVFQNEVEKNMRKICEKELQMESKSLPKS